MDSVAIQAELVPADKHKQESIQDRTIQQFQQTYGPSSKTHTREVQNDCSETNSAGQADDSSSLEIFDVDSASVCDFLASISTLILWFQRFTFGLVGLFRSLVLGHCLHLLFRTTNSNNNSNACVTAESQNHPENVVGVRKYFYLMQSLWLGGTNATNSGSPHKQTNGAWPPPALVTLAALTIFALVVHPDGLTWIMLRKIR